MSTTTLFIANVTKQDQDLHYRIPGNDQIFRQMIPRGQQLRIYQPAEKEVFEYILKQHMNTPEPFCIHHTDSRHTSSFVGLVFSYDKPVPGRVLADRFEVNDEALEAGAQKDRMIAAAAASNVIDQEAAEAGAINSGLETSVIEESNPENQGSDRLNETVEVEKPAKRGRPSKK